MVLQQIIDCVYSAALQLLALQPRNGNTGHGVSLPRQAAELSLIPLPYNQVLDVCSLAVAMPGGSQERCLRDCNYFGLMQEWFMGVTAAHSNCCGPASRTYSLYSVAPFLVCFYCEMFESRSP